MSKLESLHAALPEGALHACVGEKPEGEWRNEGIERRLLEAGLSEGLNAWQEGRGQTKARQ